MRNKVRKSLAILSLLLGIVHIIFGVMVLKTFSLELFWFSSYGLAMILTALANLTQTMTWILRIQNAVMLVFICALAFLAPEPQVWFGCFLFAGLFVLSLLRENKPA